MIVLDTNVISSLMRCDPDRPVVDWLDRQPAQSLWTTAVTLFEVRYGILALPSGRRRTMLAEALERMLELDLEGRVLEFDNDASAAAAQIAARNRSAGRPVDMRDVQIAGIVLSQRGTLATRHSRHFGGMGIRTVNPWTDDDSRATPAPTRPLRTRAKGRGSGPPGRSARPGP